MFPNPSIDQINAKRRILKITDRRTGDILFRSTGASKGIQWASCGKSIKTPFKPIEGNAEPHKPRTESEPKPESATIKRPYYVSFNNTFFAKVNIDVNNLTVDEIIAQGRSLFGIGINVPIFVSFNKPCGTARTY